MKKFPFLLLDAGPIIKLFSLGVWQNFIEHCDVTISRIVAEDEALYTEDGKERINLRPYEEQGLIKILDLNPSEVKAFHDKFDHLYKAEIHSGEKEMLAFMDNSHENWFVCSADGAVYRVLGLLGKAEQGISLEEIFKKLGLTQKLQWKYTKQFREKWTRQGQIDSIQGKGAT